MLLLDLIMAKQPTPSFRKKRADTKMGTVEKNTGVILAYVQTKT